MQSEREQRCLCVKDSNCKNDRSVVKATNKKRKESEMFKKHREIKIKNE